MKILHLDASIQADASVTRKISAAVVERLAQRATAVDIDYRDLAATPLPHFSFSVAASAEANAVLEEFLAANVVVIGAPMYNFGIPSQLKTWFDHILVAGKTFRYGDGGVEGLAGDKKVIIAVARGGIYSDHSAGAANEHAASHLRSLLGFIGITDVEFVVAEGVALGTDERGAAIDAALDRIGRLEVFDLAA